MIAITAWLTNITCIRTTVVGHQATTLYFGPGLGVVLGLIACAVLWALIVKLPSAPGHGFRISWEPMVLFLPLLVGKQTGDSFIRGAERVEVWSGFGGEQTLPLLGVAILTTILWQRLRWLSAKQPIPPSPVELRRDASP